MEERRERADAARNRRAILAAAEELLRRNDPDQVSIEDVAAAAGVGKGTVFHRFGSRAGLMRALMEERVLALHEAIASGPPPLGPGAPPGERLQAFLDAVVRHVAGNIGLLTAHEHALATQRHAEGRREANPVYLFWHGHVSALIAEARPALDADLLAHVLLGSLHADSVVRMLWRGEADRLAAGMRVLVSGLLGPSGGET
ncbi:TetR/AcrR family transcriptional regulator [Microbispora sp. NPDC049125]|uniref:TetR/AcrR family transcriptional regulator n=1 Tax=Microbispora sp. NPDC049125 TaxID=3154929 RepID=UPI003467020D